MIPDIQDTQKTKLDLNAPFKTYTIKIFIPQNIKISNSAIERNFASSLVNKESNKSNPDTISSIENIIGITSFFVPKVLVRELLIWLKKFELALFDISIIPKIPMAINIRARHNCKKKREFADLFKREPPVVFINSISLYVF